VLVESYVSLNFASQSFAKSEIVKYNAKLHTIKIKVGKSKNE